MMLLSALKKRFSHLIIGRLSFFNFFTQNFNQLIGGVLGKNLSELGTIFFDHADPFDDEVIGLPLAALVGEPVVNRNLCAVLQDDVALNFGPAFFKLYFFIKDDFLIRVSQQPVRIDALQQFPE